MKRIPVVSVSILLACTLLTCSCSFHNKNKASADPASASVPTPKEDPEPVMTPVRDDFDGISFDDPALISENSSGYTGSAAVSDDAAIAGSADNDASGDDDSDDTSEDSPSQAGIFTSSEITDELKVRITGKSYAEGCTIPYEDLRYLRLSYVDFNGETQLGEMICNKAIAADLLDIFSELYHEGYQIDKIRLIDDYNADDDASCDDNNTSCFNYRVVAGSTNLSKHAQGVAVDLNPFYNPYVTYPNGKIRISPVGSEAYADRSSDFPHKIDENDLAYKLFTEHGFSWGGHWKTLKDYQHFQKPL